MIIVDSDYGKILFNTITNCVLTLKESELDGNDVVNVSDSEKEWLEKNKFFEKDSVVLDKISKLRKADRRLLDITISFTQNCNFACTYCSQSDSKDNDQISYEVLDQTVKYIKKCMETEHYDRLGINLFGGEPLLQKEKIYYFKTALEKQVDPDVISYGIGTNGSLLDEEFLSHFDKLGICVPLTGISDHDVNRPYRNNSGSYSDVVNNLIKCNHFFNDDIRLGIRYNVGKNHTDFNDFLITLRNLNLNIQYVDVAYTEEFDYTDYVNPISKEDYSKWYITEGIDAIIRNGFKVRFPNSSYHSCKAYSPHSVKIYSDGMLGACNGYHYGMRKGSIFDISENIEKTKEILSDVKTAEIIDRDCESCKYLLICGGKYFCRKNDYCAFSEYSIEDFLIKYAGCVKAGNGDCFDV